jgi:hypothetical protein
MNPAEAVETTVSSASGVLRGLRHARQDGTHTHPRSGLWLLSSSAAVSMTVCVQLHVVLRDVPDCRIQAVM